MTKKERSEIYRKNATIHGMYGTKIYQVWHDMLSRCNNKNNKCHRFYGLRGIRVCKRWENVHNFYKDMGDPPKGKTLDRINNDKGYFPSNCRWASRRVQSINKSYPKKKHSIYRGVSRQKQYWVAYIGNYGKHITLGVFKNENDAAMAYNKAAIKYHKEYAILNIIKNKSDRL